MALDDDTSLTSCSQFFAFVYDQKDSVHRSMKFFAHYVPSVYPLIASNSQYYFSLAANTCSFAAS